MHHNLIAVLCCRQILVNIVYLVPSKDVNSSILKLFHIFNLCCESCNQHLYQLPLNESIILRRHNTFMQLKWLRCSAGGVCFNVKSDSLHQQSWRLSLTENCSRWFSKSGYDCAEWPLLKRWHRKMENIFLSFHYFRCFLISAFISH